MTSVQQFRTSREMIACEKSIADYRSRLISTLGWYCQFLEPDLKTSLRRKLTFASADKVRQMQQSFGADRLLEDDAAFEYAIENGRGGIWLNLTDEQYKVLK
jgi:hypothetical protein